MDITKLRILIKSQFAVGDDGGYVMPVGGNELLGGVRAVHIGAVRLCAVRRHPVVPFQFKTAGRHRISAVFRVHAEQAVVFAADLRPRGKSISLLRVRQSVDFYPACALHRDHPAFRPYAARDGSQSVIHRVRGQIPVEIESKALCGIVRRARLQNTRAARKRTGKGKCRD